MDSTATSAGVVALASPSPSRDASSTPFRFLDLPAELRVALYEHMVVVGKVFFTPDYWEVQESARFKHWTDYDAPSLTILRVCRQIKAEAEDVYLSKNLFVLPYNFDMQLPFRQPPPWSPVRLRRPLFSPTALKTIKNLSISYSNRFICSLTMTATSWADAERFDGVDYDTMTASERQQYAHESAMDSLANHWSNIGSALDTIHSSLSYFEMNMINAYCPQGCCRVLTDIDFGDCYRMLGAAAFRVLGLRAGEDLIVQARLASLQDLPDGIKYDGSAVCNPTNDPWEKWRVIKEDAESGTG